MIVVLLTGALLAAFLYTENNILTVRHITLNLEDLPSSFSGLTIVHLSDLHGKSFGPNQEKLVSKIRAAKPDLIVFTGDLIDRKRGGEEAGLRLMDRLTKIAPTYYVTGNHEWWAGDFSALGKELVKRNVKVLANQHDRLERGEDWICILGIDDPAVQPKALSPTEVVNRELDRAREGSSGFSILLAHRPELITIYSQHSLNVVFSGHAHGGQIRLPFLGGLIAPGQGFLPRYSSGLYSHGNTSLVVSRGLGNSVFPQRLFNRPEIIVVSLKKG
jgi:predicted MPP superfamily phosphohydrolase